MHSCCVACAYIRFIVTDVAWSVCLSVCVGHDCEPSAEPIEMLFRIWTCEGPKNHALDGDLDPSGEGTFLWGDAASYI